jgi:transposase-like protein
MRCPHCQSTSTTERPDRTELGYRCFRCRDCQHGFNERTGTPFNRLQYPTDVVCLVVLWRFRYKLSLRDAVRQERHVSPTAQNSVKSETRMKRLEDALAV